MLEADQDLRDLIPGLEIQFDRADVECAELELRVNNVTHGDFICRRLIDFYAFLHLRAVKCSQWLEDVLYNQCFTRSERKFFARSEIIFKPRCYCNILFLFML